MSSICRGPNGLKTIQFSDKELEGRPKIHLGKTSLEVAKSVQVRLQGLIASKKAGLPLDSETATWVGKIDKELHDRLIRIGLAQPRQVNARPVTLGEFLDEYTAALGHQKPNTTRNNLRARRLLEEFFDTNRTLASITEGDADDYRHWLLNEKKLAKGGIGRDIGRAKTLFKAATRKRLIPENPFAHVQCPSQTNSSRKKYVPLDLVEQVIAACPDNDWRLIFAFPRFAGLRIPSEIQNLKWSDIDWENDRFTVRATKVEHHAGHETRVVPIFPELRPYLEAARRDAKEGCEYVIARAKGGPNLRRYAEQIIKKAGVQQWPKLFVNLRASCEKDLMEVHRPDAVLTWIGHSARVHLQHYAPGATECDFRKAVQIPVQSPAGSMRQEPSTLHDARERSLDAAKNDKNQYPRQGSNL